MCYRNKLKGLPLEFVRLAVAEEMEAQNIAIEAFEDIEKELKEGRQKARITPDVPQVTDKNYPVMEFSDDEEPRHVDDNEGGRAASALDDVPMSLHKKAIEDDPALWPFPKRQQVFEPKMSLDQATQRTRHHLQEMKKKLEGKSGSPSSPPETSTTGSAAAGSAASGPIGQWRLRGHQLRSRTGERREMPIRRDRRPQGRPCWWKE